MFKNNKKGFSLIEMMIVIAIVAVLVSIVIPIVGNSKIKAAAATNAANLRQAQGAIQTLRLLEPNQFTLLTVQTAADEKFTFGTSFADAPNAQAISVEGLELEGGTAMRVTRDGDDIICTYRGYTIEMFANIAETGTIDGVDIGVKNTLMNQAEDINKRLDAMTEALKENGYLNSYTQGLIDGVAENLTDVTNTLVNGSENPDPDALAGVEAGMSALETVVGPYVCSCCKAGTWVGTKTEKGRWPITWTEYSDCTTCTHGHAYH